MRPAWIRITPRVVIAVVCVALVGILAACGSRDLIARITPPEDDAFAREFVFNLTRGGEVEEAYAKLAPTIQNDAARKGLQELEDIFGRGAVLKMETIGVHWNTTATPQGKSTTTVLSYQMQMNTGWFAGNVTLVSDGSGRHVLGARFDRTAGDLAAIHAFGAAPLTASRIGFLALAVAVPVFCVVTLVACFRSGVRRKVIWMIAIALPAVRITMNWTTAGIDVQPIALQFLGSGFLRASEHAPWMFTIAIPIGAILFWGNRRELLRTPAPPPPPPPPPPPTHQPPPVPGAKDAAPDVNRGQATTHSPV